MQRDPSVNLTIDTSPFENGRLNIKLTAELMCSAVLVLLRTRHAMSLLYTLIYQA